MTLEDARYVVSRMRDSDRLALMSFNPKATDEQYAAERMHNDLKYTLCASDGEPVAIGGGKFLNQGTIVLWLIATDRISEVKFSLVRFAKKFMKELFSCGLAHRLHAVVLDSQAECKHFAQFFGLKFEGRHPMAGANKETFVTYGKVA